jgi:phosphoribosyl 1,2-cyclic phosphodiesterase
VRYGGHTSCVALAHDDAPSGRSGSARPTLILDAGTGLQVASRLLGGEPYEGTIVLSHLHWDHTLGLPFFPAGDDERARVRVMVPEQASGEDATSLLAGVMRPPYFPIEPTELRGDWAFATIAPGEYELEGFEVLVREIPHKGGRTLGYRVGDGHATLAYLPDHSPTALGPGEDGWGEYHPSFGRAVPDYAVELGKRAGVREVVLFHHRHDRSDDDLDKLAQRLGRSGAGDSPKVSVAVEGTTIEL